jgi:glycosyltransferase involved in cell wall biosynthesis
MRFKRALVVSVVDFADTRNGGAVWSANMLHSLARVPGFEFTVVLICPPDRRAANEQFVASLGLQFRSLTLRRCRLPGPAGAVLRNVTTLVLEKYFLPWEVEARRNRRTNRWLQHLVRDIRPDVILLNYLYTSLFAPALFREGKPCCLITLNNETAFQRQLKEHGGPAGSSLGRRLIRFLHRHCNGMANWRVARLESSVHRKCAGIVALTANDLPPTLPPGVLTAVLPPLIAAQAPAWSYSATRRIFFVGAIGYYPNRLAIEWLCTGLAPELLQLDSSIGINIIGAERGHVPEQWQLPNIHFLGFADRAEVLRQMSTADLFIAPIANSFGAKIKLAECVSHGMPLLATPAALSGLPFLTTIPQMDLAQPRAAAMQVCAYLDHPQQLLALSDHVASRLQDARGRQIEEWADLLARLTA